MPVGSTSKTKWEEQAGTFYLIDPETGLPTGGTLTPFETRLPCWYYIGGEFITANGEVLAALPADATAFTISARGGAVNYNVNGATCAPNSPGYVPEDGTQTVGPLSNLVRLCVYGADATTYAHLQYWREA